MYPTEWVEELDELTYLRFRSETNQSRALTQEETERIHKLVSSLWNCPKASPGSIIAGAKLESIAGKGAFGTVWKARDVETDELRAVKVFDPDRMGDGLAVHLFRRGVRAMLYLRDQNNIDRKNNTSEILSRFIVRICEIEPHMLAFSMDWIPDKDLSKGSIRGRSLEDKLRIFRHIANAVHYAHTRPECIVHRDIKPQNIVMSGNTPILTDFDIADMAFAKTLSRRAVGGAFAYAAPEQLSGECGHLEIRSDIYSLGRLLHFFLLEKDPPLLIEDNPPLNDLDEYPEGLVKIIRRCTRRDLPMRYANVSELLTDLDKRLKTADVGAFGPNVVLAQRHWKEAQSQAKQRNWRDAFEEGNQALAYVESSDYERSSEWSYQMTKWRFISGRWLLLPRLVRMWYKRLSFPIAILVLLVLASPLSIPITQYVQSQARQDQLEQAISRLLNATTLDSNEARNAMAFLKSSSHRFFNAKKRFVFLLSQAKGKKACRLFSLLYKIAPLSQTGFPGTKNTLTHLRFMNQVLNLLPQQRRWGPIVCPSHSFPGLVLRGARSIHKQQWRIQAPHSYLYAWNMKWVEFGTSDFSHSNLQGAMFHQSYLSGTQFKGAKLLGSSFKGSYLNHIKAKGADFRYADLRHVNFDNAMLRNADFREAQLTGTRLLYADTEGAIFSANALPTLQKSRMLHSAKHYPICLSGSHFFFPSPASSCYRWHRQKAMHRKQRTITQRPAFCPKTTQGGMFILSYPIGFLKKEGVCPWQEKHIPQLNAPTSKPTSRSSKQQR